MVNRKFVCGLPVDDLTLSAMTASCFSLWAAAGRCTVCTPNAVMLAEAAGQPALRELLGSFDRAAADGDGLLLAARLTGVPLACGKVAGVELGKALLLEAAGRGLGVYLYGGKPRVAERAAAKLSEEIGGLRIVGTCDGYGDGAEAARRIAASGADLILVCLGFPRQEQWIATHGRRLGGILVGLGGSLDVYAGIKRRAPRLFRTLRLEWLWRALREPRRWRAILSAAGLLFRLGFQRLQRPLRKPASHKEKSPDRF